MLLLKSLIHIKDNSGFILGQVINTHRSLKAAQIGSTVKVAIQKAKIQSKLKSSTNAKNRPIDFKSLKGSLQTALVIQTKKAVLRLDGSTVRFSSNAGVTLQVRGAKQSAQLGFKRINTAVPFELRRAAIWQRLKGMLPIMKLAKSLI